MNVFEIAEQLGHALGENEKYVKLVTARDWYSNDEEVQAAVKAYGEVNEQIQEEAKKPDHDTMALDELQSRANSLYDQIMNHPAYVAMKKAENEMNDLLNAVNQMISYAMTGNIPDGCAHDCSKCGGCH